MQALDIIKENEIVLIISDMMMHEMDGLTLCKRIKKDILTSHIYLLMPTAKDSIGDRIDSYNAGADSYITKPFDLTLREARVKNLIHKKNQKAQNF